MFLQNNNKTKLFDFNIFIGSFLIIFFKWFSSFLVFQDENLLNKILFDVTDIYYFPFILNILDLNFSPDYIGDIRSENSIPIPLYSIIFHAIFFKFFSFSSFLILELCFLYFFLFILLKILLRCEVNYYLAVFFSLIILLIPTLIGNLQLDNINLNIINGLFSFRFPRPLVTSCYFFWGLYLALLYFKEEKYETRNFLLVGLCLSLVFVSYYYNFINLLILFFFLLIEKIFNKKKSYLNVNYKNILYSILVFLLLTSPYLYLYSVSENDFSTMIGMINLNFDLKIKLLLHFLSKIFTLKFFIVFLIITLLRYFLIRAESRINVKIVKFFYYLFIATIFSPFFFTIISPTISEIYHFLNWIIIISIFVLVIYLCLYLNFLTRKILINFPKFYNSTLLLLSIFLIVIFQYINYEKILNNENNLLRNDFIKLQKLVNQNSKELNNLLSFSVRSQVFWMLKDKKEFSSIESSISSLNFQQLEENFIKNLKFLNIDFENFSEIISNKKSSWRYNNEYIKYISWYKYQANSLVTFDNSEDFTKKEKEYIQTSSPTKTQQIILPRFEIRRLNNLFKDLNIDNYSEKPDIIILKKRSLISKYSNINNEIYCEIKGFDELKVFILNNLSACFEK